MPRLWPGRLATGLRDERWLGEVVDPERGAIPLAGWFSPGADRGTVVVLVHGLGG